MGSTRFPGKVLQKLSGKPVLAHVIARCKMVVGVAVVAVAVPDEPRSGAIQDLADEFEIETTPDPSRMSCCDTINQNISK
jgi:spore coat polysaccharide biosynthesis protein SpsF (cytidylyltransferase family)